jgi:hypothetical protein
MLVPAGKVMNEPAIPVSLLCTGSVQVKSTVVRASSATGVGQGDADDVTGDGEDGVMSGDVDGEGVLAAELPHAVTITSSVTAHLMSPATPGPQRRLLISA